MSDVINRSVELLNTVLPSFDKTLYDNFRVYNPLWEQVSMAEVDATTRRFEGSAVSETLGYGQAIRSRGQRYTFVNRGLTKKMYGGLNRFVITFAVPKPEMDAISKAPDAALRIANLYDQYIQSTANRYRRERSEWFFMASIETPRVVSTSGEYEGFASCSPDWSSGSVDGLVNGFFDAAAPPSQSKTIVGRSKSTTDDWYTQYNAISTWETDGPRMWTDTVRACREYSEDPYSTSEKLQAFTDPGSFALISAYYQNRGSYFMTGPKESAMASLDTLAIEMPLGVKMYSTPDIKPSRYSTTALTRGVSYIFNPKFLKKFRLPGRTSAQSDPTFKVSWFKDPMSDNYLAMIEIDEQDTIWGNAAAHGLLSGTGV